MNDYQKYIAFSRYARYIESENRRETWAETVSRWRVYFEGKFKLAHHTAESVTWNDIERAVLSLDVMPSMRTVWTAGKALDRDHAAAYNCWYVPLDNQKTFDEVMYLLMCGSGVGFSVERQYINDLPTVADTFHETSTTIVVADSKIGWATSLRELISLLYVGKIPKWDMSKVREKGVPLKTFGGRASGSEPLVLLFKNIIRIFENSKGRKLHSIDCHDIVCHIGDTVNVGGVRRSACISLSNLSDDRMRLAKAGNWQDTESQRRLANNSVAFTEKPDFISFLNEWQSLYASRSGERGIVNRTAFQKKAKEIGRDSEHDFGVNPCGEIILRPYQACNLTEVVVRQNDTWKALAKKVRIATIIGTMQASLTDFRYLRKIYRKNCEEEALLGVSLTGIMDSELTSTKDISCKRAGVTNLEYLKEVAVDTNKIWAKKIGIKPAAAITCVKPSGTVSQLVDSASGIHPRYAEYYVRTVINDKKDPMGRFLVRSGVIHDEDERNFYFKFPEKAPLHSRKVSDVSALEQLEIWKTYATQWCQHNPSQTIFYKDNEFLAIGQWVWENFDIIGGLSFFPVNDHVYKQPPFKEIDAETYKELKKKNPVIFWEDFRETTDSTEGAKEVACSGSQCEL